MFKKIITGLLVVCILLTLVACASNMSTAETPEETINFDLTKYKSHGELSCGRIWCSKLEGDWDTPNKEYFAYFDSNGTQLSSWYRRDGERGYNPADYKNDFVIIDQIDMPPIVDYYPVTILDINGDEIANLWVGYHHYGGAPYLAISEFSSEGIACCYAWDENYKGSLFWIDKLGAHKFNIDKKGVVDLYSPNSMRARKMGDYIVLYIGSLYNSYVAVFSQDGNLLVDVTEVIGQSVESIRLDGENIYVSFEGADDKNYNCIIDFDGNFVRMPEEDGKTSVQNQNDIKPHTGENTKNCNVPALPSKATEAVMCTKLKTLGFKVKYVYEPSTKYEKDIVLRLYPESGTILPYGSTVTMYISSGTTNVSNGNPQSIKIGVTEYPPYFYYDGKDNCKGFDYELMKTVFSKLEITPKFVEIEWSKKEELLNEGDIDCIWNALSYNEKYSKTMSLTNVYYSGVRVEDGVTYKENYVAAFRKDSNLVESVNAVLASLKNDGTIEALKKKYDLS